MVRLHRDFLHASQPFGKVTDRGIASAVAYSWICWDRDTMSKPETETVLKWV